jgi:hypothetical protein
LSISVRGVDGLARSAVLELFEIGQASASASSHLELRRRLDRILLALGDDADEIADLHTATSREYRAPTTSSTRSGWCRRRRRHRRRHRAAHDAAVQHAGHAHVMDIDEFAGRLCRRSTRGTIADDRVGARPPSPEHRRQVRAESSRRRSTRHS